MGRQNYIRWINYRAMTGHVFFTKDDLKNSFATTNENTLNRAINRLIENGLVVSPWQNFHVIVPTEYKLKGVNPPAYYIDQLMAFLKRNYYVGLLSAASIYGAAHQMPQTFFVVADGAPLRDGIKNGTKIVFTKKKDILFSQVRQINTQTGTMNVSSPLMTALDVIYLEKKIGGLSRAAEVIYELVESINLSKKDNELITAYPTPIIQRFGYVLSYLGLEKHAEWLLNKCNSMGIKFHYTPLKSGKNVNGNGERDKRWKIIINYEMDIDEL